VTPFKEILPLERKRRCMSQTDLANRLGVHQQAVSNWETGKTSIDAAKKQLLVEVLGPESELATNLDKIDFYAPSPEPRGRRIGGKLRRMWAGMTVSEALRIGEEFKDKPFEMIAAVDQLLKEKNA